jgi:hypothetical protein
MLVLGVGVLVCAVLDAEAQPREDRQPSVPDGALQVADNVKSCEGAPGLRFYEHNYQTRRLESGRDFDLMVVGLFDPDTPSAHGPPLVWLYFGAHMEITDVFLTLPGMTTERLSGAELQHRWPHVCDMVADLSRKAKGPR